jgi:DNA-binding response OmpR family regulator
MRLLLIEDEPRLSDALTYILKKNNYTTDIAGNGISGQEMAETGVYDLIILDRMLPGKEGLAVLRDIRSQGINVPVLILTAKDEIQDRVEGLDAGADDYLIKPFSSEELLARIRALSRRQASLLCETRIVAGPIDFNPMTCEVIYSGKTIRLTLKESLLLELLMKNRGNVVTREQILDRVWGFNTNADVSSIEIYVCFLRRKLELKDSAGIRIDTIRGIGYSFREANNV